MTSMIITDRDNDSLNALSNQHCTTKKDIIKLALSHWYSDNKQSIKQDDLDNLNLCHLDVNMDNETLALYKLFVLDSMSKLLALPDGKGGATKEEFVMNATNDATQDINELINKIEALGKENNYTVYADSESLERLRYLLDNLFDTDCK